MATTSPPSKLSGIARMLVQEKLISEEEANTVQSQANTQKKLHLSLKLLPVKKYLRKKSQKPPHALSAFLI
jgi:type IV pilus assembly protein PilB